MNKTKIILVEGYIHCPINEIFRIAYENGYHIKLIWNYEKMKTKGVFNNLRNQKIHAMFMGPRPHKTKHGGIKTLHELHGQKIDGIKFFVCSSLDQNKTLQITKSSFLRAFAEFLHSERKDLEKSFINSEN